MPSVAFSTSRDPARKTRSFIRDIISVIPQSSRIVRGTSRLDFTLNLMKSKDYHTGVIINSVKGNPNFFRIFDLTGDEIKELPWAIKLYGYTLEREYRRKKRKRNQPSFLAFISTLNDSSAESVLKRIFNASAKKVSDLKGKNFVTAYVDYFDPNKRVIFVEFLDHEGVAVGPRLKLKIIPRKVGKSIYDVKVKRAEDKNDSELDS